MARYHFDLKGMGTPEDVDGMECPTIEHAHREAVRHIAQLLMTQPGQFWNGRSWVLQASRLGIGTVFSLEFRAETIVPDEWLD